MAEPLPTESGEDLADRARLEELHAARAAAEKDCYAAQRARTAAVSEAADLEGELSEFLLRRRDELAAGPSAQETPAKAPAPPTQTVRSPPHTQLTPSPSRLSQPPRQLTTALTQPCAGPLATADAVHIPLGRCSRSPSTTLRCSTVPLRATWTQRPS